MGGECCVLVHERLNFNSTHWKFSIVDYIEAWREIERQTSTTGFTTLVDRLTRLGVLYTDHLDHHCDRIEMGRSLLWGGRFQGLCFFHLAPGGDLMLCIVTPDPLHFRYADVTSTQRNYLAGSESLLVAMHVMVRMSFRLSAFPHMKEEMLKGIEGPLSFILRQLSKPSATYPSFPWYFSIKPKVPTVFGYPGETYHQADTRLWGRARILSSSGDYSRHGFGVIFGALGKSNLLDIKNIVGPEGVVVSSSGHPWEVHSYLYGIDQTAEGRVFEVEAMPMRRESQGVFALVYVNSLIESSIDLTLEIGTSGFKKGPYSYKVVKMTIPKKQMCIVATAVATRSSYELRLKSLGALDI